MCYFDGFDRPDGGYIPNDAQETNGVRAYGLSPFALLAFAEAFVNKRTETSQGPCAASVDADSDRGSGATPPASAMSERGTIPRPRSHRQVPPRP
jgi:hypothetical protein